jgi:hypothetical protein
MAGLFVAGAAALSLCTDLPLYLASGVWIAPLIVLIPYAFPEGGRRAYGRRAVAAALALPAITSIWVVWLILTRGVIGHHP